METHLPSRLREKSCNAARFLYIASMIDLRRHVTHRGFSLVELSIVLVILGLLTGGILAGQSLIRAAELRKVSTQYSVYYTAMQSFRDKYFAIPGDMANATSFWGAADPTPATCKTTPSVDTKTCNGDGNGNITQGSVGSNERFRFWQHLANAGLIEGSYRGVGGGSGSEANETNSPISIANSYWFIYWIGPLSGNTQMFDGVYSNTLQFGGFVSGQDPNAPVLSPSDAWNIDTKSDDGKPGTGKILIRATGGLATCTDTSTSSAGATANYLLVNTGNNCALVFRSII